jgi:hypothetical protein
MKNSKLTSEYRKYKKQIGKENIVIVVYLLIILGIYGMWKIADWIDKDLR